MTAGGTTLKKGDTLTIDGSTGQVLAGKVAMLEPALAGEFATVMQWADGVRKLKVRANADTPADARAAIKFGAEGIGLCRTEHMFFDEDRIRAVREMILAGDEKARRAALAKLLPMQRADFVDLFKIMGGLPVTIRLLDPPLHEFLPHSEEEIAEVAQAMGADPQKLADRARELHEFNPMLGFRGCRLAIAYPEIAEMQARAIFEAAVEAERETGKPVAPEIMVPLIATKIELDLVKERIDAMAKTVGVGDQEQAQLSGRHHDRIAARGAQGRRDRRDRGVLFVRHQRSDANRVWHQPRRRRELLGHLYGEGHFAGRSVRVARSRRRRRADPHRDRARPQSAAEISSSAFAASTAAIRRRSRSATKSNSTTCRARRSACRSRGSPRRKRRSARARRWMASGTASSIA